MMDNIEDNQACARERAGVRTAMFYDRVWACTRDSIRRDRAMVDSEIITEHVECVCFSYHSVFLARYSACAFACFTIISLGFTATAVYVLAPPFILKFSSTNGRLRCHCRATS
jgi:hypothetical protein